MAAADPKNLRGVKHRPGGGLDHPALQRAGGGLTLGEMGFEFGQSAAFPFVGLLQERQPLIGAKRRRLTIQRRNGAISPHVFLNTLPVHRSSPQDLPIETSQLRFPNWSDFGSSRVFNCLSDSVNDFHGLQNVDGMSRPLCTAAPCSLTAGPDSIRPPKIRAKAVFKGGKS